MRDVLPKTDDAFELGAFAKTDGRGELVIRKQIAQCATQRKIILAAPVFAQTHLTDAKYSKIIQKDGSQWKRGSKAIGLQPSISKRVITSAA